MISTIKLLETICHSHRYTWTGYQLFGMSEDSMSEEVIQQSLEQQSRIANLYGIIKVVTARNIQWISFTEKNNTKGKGIEYLSPSVFAHCNGYLFQGRNNSSSVAGLLQVFKLALGCRHVRKTKLTGKRIESLVKCLKIKEQQLVENKSHPNTFQDYELNAGTYTKRNSNYDFAREEIRNKYFENVFGADPPVLETITISTQGCPWKGLKAVPSMANNIVDCTVVFKSKNVYKMLQKMTEDGQLIAPHAEFYHRIPTLGKNSIITKQMDSS